MAMLPIGPVEAEHFDEFARGNAAAWGSAIDTRDLDDARDLHHSGLLLAGFDGSSPVAGLGAYPLTLTVPGGAQLPMGGVTWAWTLPTHRRRGLLRGLMLSLLTQLQEQGTPLAGLGASESQLYRRYGFGAASYESTRLIERVHGAFQHPFEDPGTLEQTDLDSALPALMALEETVVRHQVGGLARTENRWRRMYSHDPDGDKRPFFFVLHRTAGQHDGFLSYRIHEEWLDGGLGRHRMDVVELHATGLDSYLALWQHCLSMDLVTTIRAERRPSDEPLFHHLRDPRRLQLVGRGDDLWLRFLDVPAALGGRRYGCDGELVIEVQDDVIPGVAGRYRVTGSADGADCRPAPTATADLTLSAAALGMLYLGDTSAATLHQSGLIDAHTPGAVRRASTFFDWSPRPWLSYMF